MTQQPFDKRRRRYVPVDAFLAFGPFGVALKNKWGMEGLCAWMLLLAAAKREPEQGIFTFTSEPEAWTKLGAIPTAFTLKEFLSFCGHHKQTRRRCSGGITYVSITGWAQWNKAWNRQQEGSQNPSKQAQNTTGDAPEMHLEYTGDTTPEYEAEHEAELEYEQEPEPAAVVATQFTSLPISIEKRMELAKMRPYLHDWDDRSLGVLEKFAGDVSFGQVCKVRESVQHAKKRIGVGYAIEALKDEAAAA
jgi:hypothetical protein